MKTSYKIVTYLVIIISLIHIGITPFIFEKFTMQVGWFIGAGLMGIFLGFINISFWRSSGKDKFIKWLCLSANVIALFYSILVITVDREPQGYIVIALFVYLLFSSSYFSLKNKVK